MTTDTSITDIAQLRERVRDRAKAAPAQAPAQRGRPKLTNEDRLIADLGSTAFRTELEKCAPKNIGYDVDRLVRAVRAELKANALLASAEPSSVRAAVVACAEMGLVPNFMGQAFLSTRPLVGIVGGYDLEAALIPGYRGLISLALRSGAIVSITARIVTDLELSNDRFELRYEGERDVLVHRPILAGERGEPALAYCIARFKDGTGQFQVEVMNAEEIGVIRDRALANWKIGNSAWITDPNEMWRKTVIRRAMKYLNLQTDAIETALSLEDRLFGGQSQWHAEATPAIDGARPAAAAAVVGHAEVVAGTGARETKAVANEDLPETGT